MRRRQLLQSLPAVLLAIPVLGQLAACVDDDYPLRPNGNSAGHGNGNEGRGGGNGSFVSHNQDNTGHSHDLLLACTEIEAGATTYTATGPHEHKVTFSDDDLSNILAGQTVQVRTTGGGHTHLWVVQMPDGRC